MDCRHAGEVFHVGRAKLKVSFSEMRKTTRIRRAERFEGAELLTGSVWGQN